ncbi:MAG: DUF1573 domain-containing protein [Bacteroidales bacterium]|jgi:hypothetical protein|nr:DUF1573 domain-containing protein [Bacteroidales bacterium]NCU34654.1 DUF1573 domain-containing protein [Candidatus Falkowbacteria bacterium]MDD2631850.1 DUF1573 domain-containing protein [Bacteroidales bacterium]MDD3132518.1 DUF1573 domain-containing protein [Bacteroidales bacterium]MDD4176343.1 DUF1573 domain-containing protein [Bacteroidales bacterium]
MINIKSIFAYLLVMMVVWGCSGGQQDDRLPADLVNNPRSASGDSTKIKTPVIHFDKAEHDFGKVIQGEKVTYAFRFDNRGKADLLITSVSSSCGCAVPAYTTQPIAPGQKGTVKVTFDSSNRRGFQNKTVTVVTNTHPSSHVLRIKAQVIVPENF